MFIYNISGNMIAIDRPRVAEYSGLVGMVVLVVVMWNNKNKSLLLHFS